MASRQQAADKKKDLSGQISTLIRTLSLSVLAVAWLFLSGTKDAPLIVQLVPKSQMMVIGALCVLSVGFDLVQYIAGYLQVTGDYKRAKESNSNEVIYSDSLLRAFAFRAKIFLSILAAFWLVALLFWAVATGSKIEEKKKVDPQSCEKIIIIERQVAR